MAMSVQTYQVRKTHHLLNDVALAAALADLYQDKATVVSFSEVDEKAMLSDEARLEVFGNGYSPDTAYELNQLILDLTRPMAAVHHALPSDLALCSASVRKMLKDSDNGASYILKGTARFVSKDPDVVAQYRCLPGLRRTAQSAISANAINTDAGARIPGLTAKIQGMILETRTEVQQQLPLPSDEENKEEDE
jgi:hypothetical protein